MKLKVESFALLDKLEGHDVIQSKLIDLIRKDSDDTSPLNDDKNRISFVDYNKSQDWEREYIKLVKPYLYKHFVKCADAQGYADPCIEDMWYQRYCRVGDKHGWHVHGGSFTGVYYLKYNNERPTATQLIQPYDQNKRVMLVVEEGDVIIFPSYMIHKSPTLVREDEKIIISFNIHFANIIPEMFDRLENI
jgi:hypothetical protein